MKYFKILFFVLFFAPVVVHAGVNKPEVEKIIKEYILENPEVLIDSVNRYQRAQQDEQRMRQRANLLRKKDEILTTPAPFAGNPKGDVVIVEFFDYNCGYCKRVLPDVSKIIKEDKNVKVIFKELPILGPTSIMTSKAALGVWKIEPDKYFDYHAALMNMKASRSENNLIAEAEKLGIDAARLKKAMHSREVSDMISANREISIAIGVSGTPAFIIGDELIPGFINVQAMKEKVAMIRKSR